MITLINKKIHYIWFGGNQLGEKEQACIESWKRYCPSYEIVRWDESNFDISQNRYCQEAYENRKWAFVSDYVRLWALVNNGGIYMDTDVEVVKPLDRFLEHHAFSGFETDTAIPTGIMACEKGFPLFRSLLQDYEGRHFVLEDGSLDMSTNVTAITNACLERGFVPNGKYQEIDGFALYPKEWFCPKSHETGILHMTENTYTIHHFSGSWLDSTTKNIVNRKHEMMKRHPNMSVKWAGALAELSYGISYKNFKPLIKSIKKNLSK